MKKYTSYSYLIWPCIVNIWTDINACDLNWDNNQMVWKNVQYIYIIYCLYIQLIKSSLNKLKTLVKTIKLVIMYIILWNNCTFLTALISNIEMISNEMKIKWIMNEYNNISFHKQIQISMIYCVLSARIFLS